MSPAALSFLAPFFCSVTINSVHYAFYKFGGMGDARTAYLEHQGLHLEHANLVEGDVHVPLNGVVVVVDAHRLLEFDG